MTLKEPKNIRDKTGMTAGRFVLCCLVLPGALLVLCCWAAASGIYKSWRN